MSKNEIFAPNGPHNKMSLPVTSSATAGKTVVAGSPVKVGNIVGVAQTAYEAADGATTGVVNSNAPGHVTVWNGGTWRLDSVAVPTGAGTVGATVYGKEQTGTSVVILVIGTPATGNGGAGDYYPFGTLYEPAADGATSLAVRVNELAGAKTTVS